MPQADTEVMQGRAPVLGAGGAQDTGLAAKIARKMARENNPGSENVKNVEEDSRVEEEESKPVRKSHVDDEEFGPALSLDIDDEDAAFFIKNDSDSDDDENESADTMDIFNMTVGRPAGCTLEEKLNANAGKGKPKISPKLANTIFRISPRAVGTLPPLLTKPKVPSIANSEATVSPVVSTLAVASQLPPYERSVLKELIVDNSRQFGRRISPLPKDLAASWCRYQEAGEEGRERFLMDVFCATIRHATHVGFCTWHRVFAGITSPWARHLSKIAVSSLPSPLRESPELHYGDASDFHSFANVLEHAIPEKGETFVDLGSGIGRACLIAALSQGHTFKRIIGIELLAPLHEAAQHALQQYEKAMAQPPQSSFVDNKPEITFIRGNFLEPTCTWTSDADVVFVSCGTFSKSTMALLTLHAKNMRPGARIILVGKKLHPCKEFRQATAPIMARFSWGRVPCYIFVRE
eukprot:g1412.t1